MRQIGCLGVILLGFLFHGLSVHAENSLSVIEDELNQAKHQHDDASSQLFLNFLSELDKAIASPDAALNLYRAAGGDMPDPAAVITQYDSETPSEKAMRDEIDQAANSNLAYVVQLHCGLMRFAGLFIQDPDRKHLNEDWIAWLKKAASVYPQIGKTPEDTRVNPAAAAAKPNDKGQAGGGKKKKNLPPDKARDMKDKPVRDSVISTYLGFKGWGDKEQGQWKVRDVPRLYRINILDPLRKTPSAATLAAWDTFIAMKAVDQTDPDQWSQVDYPSLQFERACDDFGISPSTEKLATLVTIVRNNPTHPSLDDWIARVHQMVADYRTLKAGGTPAPAPTADTNAAPAAPPTPDATPAPDTNAAPAQATPPSTSTGISPPASALAPTPPPTPTP